MPIKSWQVRVPQVRQVEKVGTPGLDSRTLEKRTPESVLSQVSKSRPGAPGPLPRGRVGRLKLENSGEFPHPLFFVKYRVGYSGGEKTE